MKASALVLLAFLVINLLGGVICFSFNLKVNNNTTSIENLPSCQLICEENYPQPPINRENISTSGDTLFSAPCNTVREKISRMSVFKYSQHVYSMLAEVSKTQNFLTKSDKTFSVAGVLSTDRAKIRLDFLDVEDCEAEYVCYVLMANDQLKVLTTAKSDHNVESTAAPATESKEFVSSQEYDLTQNLQSFVEDMKAQMAAMQSKMDNFSDQQLHIEQRQKDDLIQSEQRITHQVEALKNNISSKIASYMGDTITQVTALEHRITHNLDMVEQRLKDDINTHVTSLKSDISAQGSSTERRITHAMEMVEQRHRDDISYTQTNITSSISATELSLSQKISNVVSNTRQTLENKLVLFEDHLKSAIEQTEDSISCAQKVTGSLKSEMENLKNGVINSISDNISAISNDLVSSIYENQDYLKNVTSGVEVKLDTALDSLTLIDLLIQNSTWRQDTCLAQTKLNESRNYSCILEDKPSVPKHSQCVKGMAPIPAQPRHPYPVLYPEVNSIIDGPFLCDLDTQMGGWILIQRRSSGSENFYRGWEDYRMGFGSLNSDFWMGLKSIHKLTSSSKFELRVDLKYQGKSAYALYSTFLVGSEADNYRLKVEGYSGTAGDSLSYHNGMEFSTKDKDNDSGNRHCAVEFTGAWWYNGCQHSNLNGQWGQDAYKGPMWYTFTHVEPASFTEMKVRTAST